MEFFDSGHLASGLGDLDAVADEDGLEVDAEEAGVESEDQSAPGAGELVQIQGRAVEEVRERAQAERNSHTRFHQSYQSMSGLLAGWFEDSVFGLDNCPGIV